MVGKAVNFLIVHSAIIIPLVILVGLVVSAAVRTIALGVLRVVARPLLLLAMIALVYDGTRTLAGDSGLIVTSLAEHWQSFWPRGLEGLKDVLSRKVHPLAWEQGMRRLIGLPAWLVIGAIGLALAYVGRKRQRPRIYVN